MPSFRYTAIDPETGKTQKGKVEAASSDAAEVYLIEQGLEVLGLADVKDPLTVEELVARFQPVPLKNLVYFTRQLATMNRAGMPLIESLNGLSEGETNPKLKAALIDVTRAVQSGLPLYEALSQHPLIFDRRYIAMVRSGDAAGDMSLALRELAVDLEKQASLGKAVKSATVYPKVLLAVAFLIISGLMIFMVPKFASIFEQTAAETCAEGKECSSELPLMTRIVQDISQLLYPPFELNIFWFLNVGMRFAIAIGLIIGIRALIRRILRQDGPRERWDRFKLNAPFKIGALVQKISIARFARTYASLMKAGITSVDALPIVADTSGNKVISDAVRQAQVDILEGKSLYVPLAQSGAFPPTVIQMIKSGEETGKVDEMLERIAEFYEEEVDLAIKGLSSLIEPLMLILIGSAIGVVVIALYLPMFSIYDNVG